MIVDSEQLPSDTGSIGQVIVRVLKYEVFGDCTVGCRKAAAHPEPAAPAAFSDPGKLALDFLGRPALHPADQIGDGDFGWRGQEHVDMVARDHAMQDIDAVPGSDLSAGFPHAEPTGSRKLHTRTWRVK